MRILVERQGGVMGGAWSAEVTRQGVATRHDGDMGPTRPLTQEETATLVHMVDKVLVAPKPTPAPSKHVPDGMKTVLEVRRGDRRRRIRLTSGAKAGREIWDLIRTVREVAQADRRTR